MIPSGANRIILQLHPYNRIMTTAQTKKYLKQMDRDEMESLLLELYKRQPKNKKDVFYLMLKSAHEGTPMPDKDAVIPEAAKIRKKADYICEHTLYNMYPYIRRSVQRKLKTFCKEIYTDLISCPVNAENYDEILQLFYESFLLFISVNDDPSGTFLGVWDCLKVSEKDYFRLIVSRTLQAGFSRERLLGLFRFAVLPVIQKNSEILPFDEIIYHLMKTGDLRLEFLDLMEQWIDHPDEYHLFENLLDEKVLGHYNDPAAVPGRARTRYCMLYLYFASKELGMTQAREMAELLEERLNWDGSAQAAMDLVADYIHRQQQESE